MVRAARLPSAGAADYMLPSARFHKQGLSMSQAIFRAACTAFLTAGLLSALPPALPPAHAQERGDGQRAERPDSFDAQRTTTSHRLDLPSGALAYTAAAEFLPLREGAKEEVAARVFTIAYTQDGAEATRRPVAFVFNGGPGASSAYLHLGALGPKVVAFNADGSLPRAPSPVVDNPDSWLAFTDLVFIDPVGTGYSRAVKGEEEAEKRFWNPDADARSMAEIVRLWLVRNGRWESPKFLVGESYGGYRVARMADALFDGPGVSVNGLIMVSPVVDFATIRDHDAMLLPWAFRLPSFAAAAAALGKAPGTPAEAAAAAERFALGPFLPGLAGIDPGNLAASRDLFGALAGITGLPAELVERHRGRISAGVFAREILRGDGRIVSVYDATFTGVDPDPSAPRVQSDPFLDGTKPAYATAYAGYVQRELGVKTDVPFRLLSERVNRGWEWPRMTLPSARDELQRVLALAPGMRVLIAHGRTDLVTPYMASRWLATNLELAPGTRDRVRVTVQEGGHMMYTLAPERARLAADARALVEAASR